LREERGRERREEGNERELGRGMHPSTERE